MKILFYQHRFPAVGGIERVTENLASGFIAHGCRVEVVSHVAQLREAQYPFSVSHTPDVRFLSKANKRFLQNRIAAFRPDVIIFQDSYAPIERNLFPLSVDVPVVVVEHNAPFVCYAKPNVECGLLRGIIERLFFPLVKHLKYYRDRTRRRFLYEKCSRYVLLSERFYNEFRAVVRLDDLQKLKAIPNACEFDVIPSRNYLKKNQVLFVGSINERKGCDILINLWERLGDKYSNWELVVVGDGPLLQRLREEAGRKGFSNIRFEGRQSAPVKFFTDAKIFAFPSRREGWGLVLVEAMSRGCVPVVFDSYASVRDIVSDERNGLIAMPFNIKEFADKVERLMTNEEEREKMSNQGILSVDRYSIDKVLKLWFKLLEEVRNHASHA